MNKHTIMILRIAVLLSFIFVLNSNFVLKMNSHLRNVDSLQPKISDLTSPIVIDDLPGSLNDWTWVESQVWFGGGNGSKTNPYIIDDITIDGQNSGTCIEIKNSNKYFIIRNCTIYNSGAESHPYYGAGIRFNNVSNGKIFNNEITNNRGMGIHLYFDIENITVANNTVNNNDYGGIKSRSGIALNVYNNCVNYNGWQGIYLVVNNSIISKNKAIGNIHEGFVLAESYYNNISRNIIADNGYELPTTSYAGIYLGSSCNNTFFQNRITNSTREGIHVRWSQYNKFLRNIVKNNAEYGIKIYGSNINSRNNVIINNTIEKNGEIGLSIAGDADWNLVYNNKFSLNNINAEDSANNNRWDNGSLGNYWDDYGGSDLDDDGIGDIPYDVPPVGGSVDNYPIWDDGESNAPNIIINSPAMNGAFGFLAPDFNITINDDSLINSTWYTLEGIGGTFNFIGLTGSINQDAWDNIYIGEITITFYALDEAGNIGTESVVVIKSIPSQPAIPGYNIYLLFGAISFVSIMVLKKQRIK